MSNTTTATPEIKLANFWKKLFAWVYDLLGGVAVFILALVVGYVAVSLIAVALFGSSEGISGQLSQHPLWLLFIFSCVQYYYVWCWVKGGQTVGMRTWRLKLCKPDGKLLGWREAYIRSFLSFGGIAIFWSLFDSKNRGWHDKFCDSLVIEVPKDYHKKHELPLI